MRKINPYNILYIAIGIIFVLLLAMGVVVLWRQTWQIADTLIAEDIQKLHTKFKEINDACGIIDFEHQKNYIDFLNTISFTGSEVGSMNLMYPQKWKGPYLKENPTVQEKQYQIVRTKKGYFIVPGDGVKLGNGQIIGKDIMFDEQADIAAMISSGLLMFEDRPLAAHLELNSPYKPLSLLAEEEE